MNSIKILKVGITHVGTDAIVNAANSSLMAGGGVCGIIFSAAGMSQLQAACNAIGHCATGSAVITPAFNLKAKYIIHAVGPVWQDGNHREPQLLYGAYRRSLELAVENGCRSIGFPLISAGIFGYPQDKAWRKAIQACADFFQKNPDADLQVVFAVINDTVFDLGKQTLAQIAKDYKGFVVDCDGFEMRPGSGFDAPTIGTIFPSGTQIVKNPDGTITLIPPKEAD